MTDISIAMATFNGGRFLRQQLDSFARQTVFPIELVVCDDGSTDSTVNIIHDFSRSAPFPVVLVNNSKRLGYTANFLKAAQMCQGDLIAFSDQDDEWLPMKLAGILEASRESDAILFTHAAEWIDEKGNLTGVVYPFHRRFQKGVREGDFPGHAIVIRKLLLTMTSHSLTPDNYKEVVGNIEFGHDVLFSEIATAMNKLLFVPEVLMRWREHPETKDRWTKLLETPPRSRTFLGSQIFPPDLARQYATGSEVYRKRAALLSCVLDDLAAFGEDSTVASVRLVKLRQLMTRRADVMKLRASFYGAPSRRERTKLMLEGAALGQYLSAGKGGVGLHNALRDIVACLFLI